MAVVLELWHLAQLRLVKAGRPNPWSTFSLLRLVIFHDFPTNPVVKMCYDCYDMVVFAGYAPLYTVKIGKDCALWIQTAPEKV